MVERGYKVNSVQQHKAQKSYVCEVCGCEIPKGDYYYTYKPYPRKNYWYGWRKRCIDHKPVIYDEVFYYNDYNALTIQVKKIRRRGIYG